MDGTFIADFNDYNWYQVDFVGVMTGITSVKVIKRTSHYDRFANVEARTGYIRTAAVHGRHLITHNDLCDYFDQPLASEEAAWFTCPYPMKGQYLTLQNVAYRDLSFREIYVYTVNHGTLVL